MIILFMIQMNEERADEGDVGIYRSRSAFPATWKRGHWKPDLWDWFSSLPPLIIHLHHSLTSKKGSEIKLQREGSDFVPP